MTGTRLGRFVTAIAALILLIACGPASPETEGGAAAGDAGETAETPAESGEGGGEFPSKPVIFVAPGTLGGGSDVQARLAADIVTETGIFGNEPVAVLNRGGGGSQEAFTFMLQHSGDPHYLLTFQPSLISYVLLGEAAYELEDFVPIARVALDPVIVVTRADSEFKTLDDLISAAQAAPDTITMGGGGVAGPDRMGLLQLMEAADFSPRYVPFAGGGEIHQNVLGGHVQAAVGNPSDFMASIEAGELVGLALLDEERSTVPALQDVPTAAEQGYDVSFHAWRGWFTTAGVSDEAIETLEAGFKEVTEHPDFKTNYTDRYGMRVAFMPSDEFGPYIQEMRGVYEEILRDAGVIE